MSTAICEEQLNFAWNNKLLSVHILGVDDKRFYKINFQSNERQAFTAEGPNQFLFEYLNVH